MEKHTNNVEYVPTEEQETTVNFARSEQHATVWTNDITVMTKLNGMCEKSPDNYSVKSVTVSNVTGRELAKEYVIADKTLLSFRTAKITFSEEEKKKRAERLKGITR